MRLICPNCDAEYLVDDSAIPDSGRDVQCSNCGHAWFQLPPEVEAALAHEEALFGDADAGVMDDAAPPAAPEMVAEPPPVAAPAAAPVPPAPVPPANTPAAEPARRNLDDSILSVLREEAELETAARKAEAPPMESQVEMGLSAPAAPQDAAARRIARLKGLDPDARPVPPPKPGSRRELLPDIEEINSTLKPAQRVDLSSDGEDDLTGGSSGAGGFRSGFTLMLILAAGLVVVYVMAPKIAAQIPGAKGAMDSYVATVDAARIWLDDILRQTTEFLRGVMGQ